MSITTLIWNMFVVGGCGVAVFGLGHSGYWFIAALAFVVSE
jgi:hypothetical protein